MTTEDKIEESEFFYNKIKENYTKQADIQKYFSAFLSSSRSTIEHLLEEYNQKFGLGISLEDKLDMQIFRRNSTGNTSAMEFITWLDREITRINQDQTGHFMWQSRNLNIHRKTQRSNHIVVNIIENVNSGTSSSSVRWCFQEIPNVDIMEACELFLDMMKKVVSDARSQFT